MPEKPFEASRSFNMVVSFGSWLGSSEPCLPCQGRFPVYNSAGRGIIHPGITEFIN